MAVDFTGKILTDIDTAVGVRPLLYFHQKLQRILARASMAPSLLVISCDAPNHGNNVSRMVLMDSKVLSRASAPTQRAAMLRTAVHWLCKHLQSSCNASNSWNKRSKGIKTKFTQALFEIILLLIVILVNTKGKDSASTLTETDNESDVKWLVYDCVEVLIL